MKQNTIKLISTREIAAASRLVDDLKVSLPSTLNQKWFMRRVSMSDKIEYIKALSESKSRLFRLCESTYPELRGCSYSVGSSFVEYQNDEGGDELPATEPKG